MLSLSDVTQQQSLDKNIHINKTQSSHNLMLSNDLMGPFQSISLMCEKLLSQKKMDRKQQCLNYKLIQSASKYAQLKI